MLGECCGLLGSLLRQTVAALAEVGALGPVSSTGHRKGRGGCGRATAGRVCEETGVVAEADGVALAEVGALGPVSSTGRRTGKVEGAGG